MSRISIPACALAAWSAYLFSMVGKLSEPVAGFFVILVLIVLPAACGFFIGRESKESSHV